MLRDQLQADLISAMKAKDESTTGALRLLLSSVKNKQIELGHALEDQEFLTVVQREVKQRRDSIAQYLAAARQDLADVEEKELSILTKYMPEQLSESEVVSEVEQAITKVQASVAADMGKVMAALGHLKGKADMGTISSLVKQKLG